MHSKLSLMRLSDSNNNINTIDALRWVILHTSKQKSNCYSPNAIFVMCDAYENLMENFP